MKKPSGLALLLVVPAFALGACGGGGSDKDKVKSLIENVSKDPANLCDHATADLLKQVGGKTGCEKAAKGAPKETDITVNSVDINGDKATAKVTAKAKGKSDDQTVKLVKEGGDWKISG